MTDLEVVLSVKKVSKEFGKGVGGGTINALTEISFDLHKGEILGIIGANGAGKSTLLKILSEITTPTSGTVEYKGKLRSILEVGTGFHPDLTGKENVYLSGKLHGLSKLDINQHYDDLVTFSGLGDFMDMPVKKYSSGMYLRLAFSVAFHSKMDILVVDEVLSVGDLKFITKCHERVREIAAKGVSIILVTHNTGQVVEFCHRCILISKGQIDHEGPPLETVQLYVQSVVEESRKNVANVENTPMSVRSITVNGSTEFTDVSMSQEIVISFEAHNPIEGGSIEFNLSLTDMNGSRILFDGNSFRKGYQGIPSTEGWYKVNCVIPPDLLNRGVYFVGVVMGNNRNKIGEIADLCRFTVHPDSDEKLYMMMTCSFTPKLDWQIKKID